MRKNPKSSVAMSVIKPDRPNLAERYPDVDDPKHLAKIANVDRRNSLIGIAAQIAESNIWFGNWRWPDAQNYYPNETDMRFVDKCYPYAKGGMLLVDEPIDLRQIEKAYEKQKLLKKLGFRSIVVEPSSTLFEILEMLEKP